MKTVDQLFQSSVLGQNAGIWQLKCYLRIFQQPSGQQIVVMSDHSCEIGWFIPQKLEQQANQIVEQFELNPDRIIWIEHNLAYKTRPWSTEFSRVVFEWEGTKGKNPQWYDVGDELRKVLHREIRQVTTFSPDLALQSGLLN